MNRVALTMLVGDRLKYFGLVAGLAFAAMMITQQASLFSGYVGRMSAWLRDTSQADLWVMDPQVQFTEDRKPLLDTTLLRVRGVEGVDWAVPFYKSALRARLPDGTLASVRVIGLDDATLIGAPPQMVTGALADLRRDRAVLVDAASLADGLRLKTGLPGEGPRPLRVGDRLDINDHEMVAVGVYRRSTEFFWDPVIYTTFSRALAIAPPERKQTTSVLVKVQPGHDVRSVARAIEAATGQRALTGREFEVLSRDYMLEKTGILANFGITILLGFIIGLLVAGQLLYTFVLDNLRYYAAMKAMGATNGTLVRMVGVQVLAAGGAGFGIGAGGAALSGLVMSKLGLGFRMVWQIPVIGAAAILVVCGVAALISLSRVLRLEPGVVFKG